jgi:predicted transcriptional regulator of viral defense system
MKQTRTSKIAAQNAIRRARDRGVIATPYRSFHVRVPPEYKAIGSLPAELFIDDLMKYLDASYYVSLLTAASYYGASHHAPQEFQVIIGKPRPPMEAGKVKITFSVRKDIAQMEVVKRKNATGFMVLATPETTAFDLVGYPHRCGGLDHVTTVISELAHTLNSQKLLDIAERGGPIGWAQRLGYLLQLVGAKGKAYALAQFVRGSSPRMVKLDPQGPISKQRDKQWRVIINRNVEPEA